MVYATYEEYRTLYAGTLFKSEEQYLPYAKKASDFMDAVTSDRLRMPDYYRWVIENAQRQIKKCCCALAENELFYVLKTQPEAASSGAKQSEAIGEYSVTYVNPLDSLEKLTDGTFFHYQYQTAMQYLGRTGLMFRGV